MLAFYHNRDDSPLSDKLLEELKSIRAIDAAKKSRGKSIPFEQAIAEIEHQRK